MTASVIQEAKADDAFGSGAAITSPALAANATVGSTIEVWVTCSNNGANLPSSVVDSASQSYSNKQVVSDATSNQSMALYVLQNNASATKLTVTVTYGAAETGKGVWVKEIGGVTTTAYDNSVIVVKTAPGTGADLVTTTTISPSTSPVLCSGIAMEEFIGDGSDLAAGTGYTLGTTGWSFGGSILAKTESKRLASVTATAATFRAATNGASGHYLVGLAMYNEAAGGPVVNTKAISETTTIADSEPHSTFRNRQQSDSLTPADSLATFRMRNRLALETLSPTDSQTQFATRNRQSADGITLTDAQARIVMRTRGIIDTLVAADILTNFALHSRSLAEAIAVIDLLTAVKSGSAQVLTKSITESVVLADQMAQFKLLWRAAVDPFSPADVESRYVLKSRQLSDSMLITDAEQPFAFRNRTQVDTAALTDVEQAFRVLNRQVQDPFAIIDILVALHSGSVIHTLSVVDTLVAIDQLTRVMRLTRSQLDSFPVIEQILAQFIPFISASGLVKMQVTLGMYDAVSVSAQQLATVSANDNIFIGGEQLVTLGSYQPIRLSAA